MLEDESEIAKISDGRFEAEPGSRLEEIGFQMARFFFAEVETNDEEREEDSK